MDIFRSFGWVAAVGLLCAGEAAGHGDAKPDVVLSWNQRVLEIAEAEDGLLTLKGVRTAAMMHIAMHDALNAVDRRFAPYAHDSGEVGADPVTAAAQAAYEVAVSQFPDQAAGLQSELDRWLAATPDEGAKTQATALGAGWAHVRPFLMGKPDQFRSPPPPSIASNAYAVAFDEVKKFGRYESRTRTADQTHLAMWWKEFVEASHNRLARKLVSRSRLDLWEAARLFALLNMSIMDAYIGSFDAKFHYNHWRPYTAIRWAAHDGNPRTKPDPDWNNLHRHTYAFPSYPSAHGTACAAAMTVLGNTLGDRREFTMTIPLVDRAGPGSPKIAPEPVTRSFDSFSAAALECAMSRVYLGIHFRYDSIEGNRLGTRIGSYGWKKYLVPISR